MAAILKCGAIFFHIPKTAGAWVSEVLQANNLIFAHVGGIHSTPEQLISLETLFKIPRRYSRPNKPFFRFCFVRHPLRWYESWFKMMTARNWQNWGDDIEHTNPTALLDGLGSRTFDGFISNVLEKRPGFVSEMYGDFVRTGMHFVGRQEHIVNDLVSVLSYLGVPPNLEQVKSHKPTNVSNEMNLVWNPELQKEVEQRDYTAFIKFNYQTELYSPPTNRISSNLGFLADINSEMELARPFEHDTGWAWKVRLPRLEGLADNIYEQGRSTLMVYEDNVPIYPKGHCGHSEIRDLGSGRFSHWKKVLLFSTRDNSNPNINGKRYTIRFHFGGNPELLMTN
jgi:hypothetical protein